jgi:hypothetical protein
MTTLTAAMLEAFARDPAVRSVVRGLVAARKNAAKVRADVDALLAPVFATFSFTSEHDGTPIADPDKLYLAELETPQMRAWEAARADAIEVAGYKVPTREHCPALMAEHDARKLEWRLLELVGKLAPELADVPDEHRETVITLFCDLVSGRPKPRRRRR